jgi:hypothetical protein
VVRSSRIGEEQIADFEDVLVLRGFTLRQRLQGGAIASRAEKPVNPNNHFLHVSLQGGH